MVGRASYGRPTSDDQGEARRGEARRPKESEMRRGKAPKMSDGRHNPVGTIENVPARPAADDQLPLRIPELAITPVYVGLESGA